MNEKVLGGICLITVLFCFCSCNHEQPVAWKAGIEEATDTVPYQQMFGESVHGVLVVKDDVDLINRKCCLPKGVTLNFQGGVIKNGTLVGDETKIDCYGACFDRVRIQGSWNVPDISTRMFKDMDYDNSLKDVVALASPNIENVVVIEPGDYQVSARQNGDVCLPICGNTLLQLNGTIRLTPNEFKSYAIVQITGNNIEISGVGNIIGDKHTHTGDSGEWGMGVDIRYAHHVSISGITIKDCWGDCIYVGGKSTIVTIDSCQLDHGRRQGISITYADGVTIRDCKITNIAGTAPEYAIDLEPNGRNMVDHVLIENIIAKDCKGGIGVNKNAEDAKIGSVTIRNCNVSAVRKAMANLNSCDTVVIENCDLTQKLGQRGIVCKNNGYAVIRNNRVRYHNGIVLWMWDFARKIKGRERAIPINVANCGDVIVERNIVNGKEQ